MTYPNKSKFIAIYKAAQAGHPSAEVGLKSLSEEQRQQFAQFQVDAGNAFLEIKDELDAVVDSLGDDFSSTDPRHWTGVDWQAFYARIADHPYEEILTKYAKGENNISLIWELIESRL